MHLRAITLHQVKTPTLLPELLSEKILRTVTTVTPHKKQLGDVWDPLQNVDQIPKSDIHHGCVGCVLSCAQAGFNDISDTNFMACQQLFALPDRITGIIKPQRAFIDLCKQRPEIAVGAAITEIHIPFPQLTCRKSGWRQGSDDQSPTPFRDKDRIGVKMTKHCDKLPFSSCDSPPAVDAQPYDKAFPPHRSSAQRGRKQHLQTQNLLLGFQVP